MTTRTIYEKKILAEIHDLPEAARAKLMKLIQSLKREFLLTRQSEQDSTKRLIALCGSWEDSRSVEEQLSDVYDGRKSVADRESLK